MPDGHGLAGWAGGPAWSGAGAGLGRTLIGGWPVRRWRQRGRHQGQHLVACVRPPRRISEVNVTVDEFTQTQVLGEGDRKEQPSIGHQTVVIKGDLDAVGMVKW